MSILPSTGDSSPSQCQHNDVIDNVDGYETVCSGCGLVIDTFGCDVDRGESKAEWPTTRIFAEYDELTFKAGLTSDTALKATKLYGEVTKAAGTAPHLPLLAVCLYEVLKRDNIPRSIKEIAALTGCSEKKMNKCINEYFPNSLDILPHQMINRVAQNLGFKRKQALKMEEDMKQYEEYAVDDDASPATKVSFAIMNAVKKHSLGIEPAQVVNHLGISITALKRYTKKMLRCQPSSSTHNWLHQPLSRHLLPPLEHTDDQTDQQTNEPIEEQKETTTEGPEQQEVAQQKHEGKVSKKIKKKRSIKRSDSPILTPPKKCRH